MKRSWWMWLRAARLEQVAPRAAARARSSSGSFDVRVSTAETTLVAYGGTCPAEFCWPAGASLAIGSDWQQYVVEFDQLTPSARGVPFRKDRLTNIQFLFTRVETTTEFWLDDLSFFTGPHP
jgi:hypothetical protein